MNHDHPDPTLATFGCKIDGCDRELFARRMCWSHWHRWRHHGHPLAGQNISGSAKRWLEDMVQQADRSVGCWLWPFATYRGGYGKFTHQYKTIKAHHAALEMDGRPRPVDAMALHSCDTPACVNPEHLRWGTAKDNAADAILRGRAGTDPEPRSPLTADEVREIVKVNAESSLSQHAIAARFGVSQATVSRIVSGRTWSSITGIEAA